MLQLAAGSHRAQRAGQQDRARTHRGEWRNLQEPVDEPLPDRARRTEAKRKLAEELSHCAPDGFFSCLGPSLSSSSVDWISDDANCRSPMVIQSISPGTAEARALIEELDTEIAALYPGAAIEGIDVAEFEMAGGYFVVAREAEQAVGCGGFRPVDERCAEIKRMFVRATARRRGIGRRVLRHLEAEVRHRGFSTLVLETGCDNIGARALYEAEGYSPIPAFLGYVGIPISRCYAKRV